jgi:putative copper resistance protein D
VLIALVLCRFMHFAACMLLFGAAFFVSAFAPAALARRLTPSIKPVIAAAIRVAALSALAWLALEAGEMGEGWADSFNPDILSDVLTGTAYGRVWIWRLALALILVCVLAFRQHHRLPFVAVISALLLASLGLVGHATMQAGVIGAGHRLNHSLHLLMAGGWLGGLWPFILCLRQDAAAHQHVGVALRRFSGVGHFAVALLVLTGVVNTVLTLGAWPIDFSSPYRTLLLAKIAVVALMIAMALFNRYALTPRIKNDAEAASRALAVNSAVELALGALVLALVSLFGILAPV